MELYNDFLQKYEELMNENVESALEYCIKTLEKVNNPELYIYIAECNIALSYYEEAVATLDRAINEGCKNINFAKSLKGEALFYLEKFEESKEIFEELLEVNPNSFFTVAYLTDIDINLGNYKEGVERAEKILKEKRLDRKDSAYIEVNIGWIKLKYLCNKEEALEYFSHAIALDPTLGIAYVGFATYFLEEEDYVRAIENYETALDLGENTIDVYFGTAQSYKGLGQLEDALEYFNIVYNADPSNKNALLEIEEIQGRL